jgi:hypothetical protein
MLSSLSQNVSSDHLYSIQNTEQMRRLLKNQSETMSRQNVTVKIESQLDGELSKLMLHTSRLLNSYKAQLVDARKQKQAMTLYIHELE